MDYLEKISKFIKFYYRIWLFEIVAFGVSVYNTVDLSLFRLKRIFVDRLKTYLFFALLFYLFQSHLDYMMYEDQQFISVYLNSYSDRIWRNRTFCFSIACFFVYTVYFILSLFSVKVYDHISRIGRSLSMIFFVFTFKYYAWFYELELNYFYNEGTFVSIFIMYFFMYWGVHAIEFGYNLEEEFDDPRWILLSNEARKNNTFQPNFGWFTTGLSLEDELKISHISETDMLMAQIFGDIDDYGESLEQTFARYSAHLKKMYPEYVDIDDMTDEEREYELAMRKFNSTPSNIEEVVEWWYYNPEKWRNFYANRIKPYFYKYRFIFWVFKYISDWFKVGSIFRARSVGLYSVYNPIRKINNAWLKQQCFETPADFYAFGRYFSYRFIYVFIYILRNKIKIFSIFYFINRFKWKRFHYKYYPKLIKLRKWGSGNYNFFKDKNT